jgi:hypothetical protein
VDREFLPQMSKYLVSLRRVATTQQAFDFLNVAHVPESDFGRPAARR